MRGRRTAPLLALVLGAGLGACSEPGRPGVQPRHLLLLTVERARADRVTYLGYPRATTGLLRLDQPTVLDLDHLAEEGVVFARAFAPSSSDALSLATLAGASLDPGGELSAPTLTEALAAAGFETAGFFNQRSLDGRAELGDALGRGFDEWQRHGSDEETLLGAVRWLQSRGEAEEQRFTWIHLADIAAPFAGDPLEDRFSVRGYAGPVRPEAEFFARLAEGGLALSATDRARLDDLYDGRLTRTTELLNSFFYYYRHELGGGRWWDETLFALVGSSGCELAERPGRVARSDSLADAGLHVPLILTHPASLTGERILGSVVGLDDLGATLREVFGLEGAEAGTGRSLLRLTDSRPTRDFPERALLSLAEDAGGQRGASLRTPRWRFAQAGGAERLHDLEVDPGEQHDVLARYPDVAARLREELAARLAARGLEP